MSRPVTRIDCIRSSKLQSSAEWTAVAAKLLAIGNIPATRGHSQVPVERRRAAHELLERRFIRMQMKQSDAAYRSGLANLISITYQWGREMRKMSIMIAWAQNQYLFGYTCPIVIA